MYGVAKFVHVACVVLAGAGFFLRGFLVIRQSPLLRARWVKILPHVNDSVLLGAAIVLVVITGQYPFIDAWVTAKVFGLMAYIVLGALALKGASTPAARIAAWLAALTTFGYIVSVALTKNPLGFVRLVGG